jgi:S1-C subfamily serine protease
VTSPSAPPEQPVIAPVRYIGVQVEDTDQGVRITQVGANAEQAGLNVGDYITAIDGEPIETSQQFIENMSARSLLSQVTFSSRRGISTIFIRVTLSHLDFGVPTADPSESPQ